QFLCQIRTRQRPYIRGWQHGITTDAGPEGFGITTTEFSIQTVRNQETLGRNTALAIVQKAAGHTFFDGNIKISIIKYQIGITATEFQYTFFKMLTRHCGNFAASISAAGKADGGYQRM